MMIPIVIIVYGEFTTLLVDRALGIGTSSSTIFLPLFGGGKILLVKFVFHFISNYLINNFINNNRTNATIEENQHEIINDSIAYGILLTSTSVLHLLVGIVSVDCFNHMAIRQITRIRVEYFKSLMRQEIGWYDNADNDHNFTVRITEYVIFEII